jgi:hypothetical protein
MVQTFCCQKHRAVIRGIALRHELRKDSGGNYGIAGAG